MYICEENFLTRPKMVTLASFLCFLKIQGNQGVLNFFEKFFVEIFGCSMAQSTALVPSYPKPLSLGKKLMYCTFHHSLEKKFFTPKLSTVNLNRNFFFFVQPNEKFGNVSFLRKRDCFEQLRSTAVDCAIERQNIFIEKCLK